MIVYEIMTNERPFNDCNYYQLILKIKNGVRPEIPNFVPACYKELIKDCWSQFWLRRPRFDAIINELEKNTDFITPQVDKQEYYRYINYIKKAEEKNSIFAQPVQVLINEDNKNLSKQIKHSQDQLKKKNEIVYSLPDGFLDLKNFEKDSIINKSDLYKIYKIREKSTNCFYSAKISLIQIDQLSRDKIIQLSREVNIISQVNHPSLLKFIGYSPIDFKNHLKPVIVAELPLNKSLKDILEIERKGDHFLRWDDTKKLICLYGIASGMAYLHLNNIILRNLNPENIYFDDNFFPKIGDFGLSSRYHSIQSMTFQTTSGLKGTPSYLAPEIFESNKYSKNSDVYAFAFIIYEIITKKIPFRDLKNTNELFIEVVVNSHRPKIKKQIPASYKNLIEKCWSQFPNDRPTFEQIVEQLKSDDNFITKNINRKEYQSFIKYIDESIVTFDSKKRILQLDDVIRSKSGNNEEYNEILIQNNNENAKTIINNEENNEKISNSSILSGKIDEYISSKQPKKLIEFLINNCDFQTISSVFDKCFYLSSDFYIEMCKEGIFQNNPVAYHKYALLFIFGNFNIDPDFELARNLLEKSIKNGFYFSYFILARLFFEVDKNYSLAFETAQKGTINGDKYSQCLLGYFIAHGIGIEKDNKKGIEIILESGASDFYEIFSTDIGIYYLKLYEQNIQSCNKVENKDMLGEKAFEWFEKSFNKNKTKASVNNYALCFMKGIGVHKNIKKANEIINSFPNLFDFVNNAKTNDESNNE